MTNQWISAPMRTGVVNGDLAGYQPDYPYRRTLSNYDTATGRYYLDSAPADWPALLQAGGVVLAVYDDADAAKGIQWAGYVTKCEPDSATDSVAVSLSTIEGYLSRRYAGDLQYLVADGWTVAEIVDDLIARYIVDGAGGLPGIPLATEVVGTSPAITSDITWQNTDNAKVLERIQALFGQYGGEFAVEWVLTDTASGQTITPTLYHGPRIGVAVGSTGQPGVTFELPGPITSLSMPTDYGDGAGANHVTAYSSGQGDSTPFSAPVIADNAGFAGRPTFEVRFSPTGTVDSDTALDDYASRAAMVLVPGAQPLSLVLADAALEAGQRLGTDWRIGDEVGYHVAATPAFPGGIEGVGRVISIEKTDQATTTPIFAQPETYGG